MGGPTAYGTDLIDPDTLFNASARFLDVRVFSDGILGGLIGNLSGTAGMVGADSKGAEFAASYDQSARSLASAIAQMDLFTGQVSNGLLITAGNYWGADSASNMALPIDVSAPAMQLECDQAAAFTEAEVPAAQGAGVGTWDEIRDSVLAAFWPQADTGKVRDAAAAWISAGSSIAQWEQEFAGATAMVTGPNSGGTIDAFSSTVQGASSTLSDLGAKCTALGNALSAYAKKVDSVREEIKSKVGTALGVAAGVAIVGGILTVFTLGGSDVAAAGIDAAVLADVAIDVEAIYLTLAEEVALVGGEEAAAAALVEEAEAYLASVEPTVTRAGMQLATTVKVIGTVSIPVVVVGVGGSTAGASPPNGPPGGSVPPGSQIPPSGQFPLLTPQERAEFLAWLATLPNRPENSPGPAFDYQRRVAGPNTYTVPTDDGRAIQADGYREADGALIDTKFSENPSCSAYNQDGGVPDFIYTTILAGEDDQIDRYTAAIRNAANRAQFLEVDVNDPLLVPYFQALLDKYHCKGIVRVVP